MGKKEKVETLMTFLGAGTKVEGTIEFTGTIRLDGIFRGRLISESGTVIAGQDAVIEADLEVGSAIIRGKVTGTINAKRKIEVLSPGQITGDIQAPVISIDPGVVFRGNCITMEDG